MSTITGYVPPRDAAASPRLSWLDTFRGLLIILVVVGHVLGGLAFSPFVSGASKERLWLAYDLIYAFHMPAFFLASGLLAARSVRKGVPGFLADKTRTLAYPYLLWSLIGWALHSVVSGLTNTEADPMAPLKMFYDPRQGVWFLYVLFVLMIGYGLWTALGQGRRAFLALGVAAHAIVPFCGALPILVEQVARFLPYFGLGLLLSDHVRDLADWFSSRRLAVLIPASFAAMMGSVALGLNENPWLDVVPALCGTLGMCGVAMVIDRLPLVLGLRACGRQSLPIYLAGGHGSVATRILLQRGAGVTFVPTHILLDSIAGLLLPLALVAACKAVGFRYAFTWPKPGPIDAARLRSATRQWSIGRRSTSMANGS